MPQVRKATAERIEGAEWVSLRVASQLTGKNREAVLILALKRLLEVDLSRPPLIYVSRASIDRYLAGVAE